MLVPQVAGARPATVTLVESGRRVAVTVGNGRPEIARVAVVGSWSPRAGNEVLVVSGAEGELYVIGVLSAEAPTAGGLIAEHLPDENRTVIRVPEGDLEIRADGGSIRLAAAGIVDVDAQHARVKAPRLEVLGARADVALDEGHLSARRLESTLGTLLQVVGVVETRAERIVERARAIYTDVEELAQTHAGRVRVVARETFHLLGKRAILKSEEDMKIKGKTIHLD